MKRHQTVGWLVVGAAVGLAQAQTIQISGGTTEENRQVSGRNRLVIAATGNPDGTVSVTVSAGTVDFEYIRVRPQRGTGQVNGSILLLVRESGSGIISRISEITMLPTTPQAELLIGNVTMNGSISTPSGALATIAAPVVGELDVSGDIVAQITSGPRLFTSATDSTINRIRTFSGSILGSVTDLYGPINTISAAGSIGSAATPTTIRGSGLVQSVTAQSLADGSTIIAGSLTQNYIFGTSSISGLAGQVIINPASNGGTWSGNVRAIGSASSVLSPRPNYSAHATDLGGGAVGLVPFRLHREDTAISPAADNSDSPLLNSEFCGKTYLSCDNCTPVRPNPTPFHFAPRHISLNYYGPIRAETPGTCV